MTAAKRFVESAGVKLTTAAIVIVFLVGLAWSEGEHRANQMNKMNDMARQVAETQNAVKELSDRVVGKTPNGFHRSDFIGWVRATKQSNAEWMPAPVPWAHANGTVEYIEFQ